MSSPVIGTKGVPRPEREQQILAAALDEFAAAGYARASIAAIAARAGISKPLIYQYFGSKDGLYLACLNQVAGVAADRSELAEERVDDTVESRIHPLRAVFEALSPQRNAWRLLYDATMPPAGAIGAAAAHYRRRTERIASAGSERFLQVRGFDDPRDAAVLSQVWTGIVDALVALVAGPSGRIRRADDRALRAAVRGDPRPVRLIAAGAGYTSTRTVRVCSARAASSPSAG